MTVIQDPDLADVLGGGCDDDIKLLIDVITDGGKGRVSLSSSVCDALNKAKDGNLGLYERALVAEELSRFGGNSLMNLLRRGSGVPYKELLCDVASHVEVSMASMTDCAEIEMAIIAKMVERSLNDMSEEEKATFFASVGGSYTTGMGPAAMAMLLASLASSRASSYGLAAMVASATMKSIVGRGVAFAGGATLGRGLAVLAGPLGWAITGIWTAFDLASPAYRVTVPCVIQIGYMRQKMLLQDACPRCHTKVGPGSKFCGNCGEQLTKALPRALS